MTRAEYICTYENQVEPFEDTVESSKVQQYVINAYIPL